VRWSELSVEKRVAIHINYKYSRILVVCRVPIVLYNSISKYYNVHNEWNRSYRITIAFAYIIVRRCNNILSRRSAQKRHHTRCSNDLLLVIIIVIIVFCYHFHRNVYKLETKEFKCVLFYSASSFIYIWILSLRNSYKACNGRIKLKEYNT